MSSYNKKQTVKITYDPASVKFYVLNESIYPIEKGDRFNKFGRTYSPKGIKDKIFELRLKGINIMIDPYIIPEVKSELEKYLQIKESPLEMAVSQPLQ